MRGIWIRRLIPASVVSLVLVFSYFAPALGVNVDPVKSHDDANCGRFGYGYHGGKHNFVCPTHPPPAGPDVAQVAPATRIQAPAALSASPTASQRTLAPVTAPATKSVVDAPVADGVTRWRAFIELVLRELSS